jgi:hypothetical protein
MGIFAAIIFCDLEQINCRILLSVFCQRLFDLFLIKGSLTREFLAKIFSLISFPRALEYPIWSIAIFLRIFADIFATMDDNGMKHLQQYSIVCLHLKGTLSKKIIIWVYTSTTYILTKYEKTFCLQFLSLVSLKPVIDLYFRISPRIFVKN